jgi:phage-related protein (TIGR01555 family)
MDYGFSTQSGNNEIPNPILRSALFDVFLTVEEREKLEKDKEVAGKSRNLFDAVNNSYQNTGPATYDPTFNGLGLVNKRSISWQLPKLDSIMRDTPQFEKASSWKATRALLNGIDINSRNQKNDDITLVQMDLSNLFNPLHSTIKLGDYYGGAGALIVCDDTEDEEDYMQPLVISKMPKNSFKGLKPLARLYQIQPDLDGGLVTKVGEEYGIYGAEELGQPKYYRVNLSGDTEAKYKYFRVHRSRLLLYNSFELSWVEKRIEMYFGPTLLERAYISFANLYSLRSQVVKLVQRSNIPVLNMANLPMISMNGEKFAEKVTARIKGINIGASAGNMIVIGDKEKEAFDYKNADLAHMNEILASLKEDFSADLDAPTKIVFNSKEEEDEKPYLVKVEEIQERIIRTWFRKLIPILYKNRFGKQFKDFTFSFKSLEILSEEEKASKLKTVVDMLDVLFNSNIIDAESYQMMLLASQDNISDIFNAISETYREYVKSQSDAGEPMTKMKNDIELATALNHAEEQGDGLDSKANKSHSAQMGKEKGGDPKKKKKPTVKVPIKKKE